MIETESNPTIEELRTYLDTPRPIQAVEEAEATAKKQWATQLEAGLTSQKQEEFVTFFFKLGFLPKYKSYGTKYAAPFGYSLFDLQNNAGFSIQLHESEKIEAFHVLATHKESFILLGSPEEWEQQKADFVSYWEQGSPEQSSLVFTPRPGDIALVENLNTVHTVIGCILEEYATSSYDVVTRLHDQNKGQPTAMPSKHIPVSAVLNKAKKMSQKQTFQPLQLLNKQGEDRWQRSPIQKPHNIVTLPSLQGKHLVTRDTPIKQTTPEDMITTLVCLEGETMLRVGQLQQLLQPGDTTALPSAVSYEVANASVLPESRLSLCEVPIRTAFADLR